MNSPEYQKEWRKNNPEKQKAYNRKYIKNNPEKVKAAQRKCYYDNQEDRVERAKKWNREHSEIHRKRALEWNKNNPERFKELKKQSELRHSDRRRESGKRWREKNKEKLDEYRKKYYADPKVKERYKKNMETWRLKRRESIAGSKKPELCPVCGRKPVGGTRGKGRMCIDHCHKTGKIRGWLCDDCNVALGRVDDRIDILKNLIKYLRKNV